MNATVPVKPAPPSLSSAGWALRDSFCYGAAGLGTLLAARYTALGPAIGKWGATLLGSLPQLPVKLPLSPASRLYTGVISTLDRVLKPLVKGTAVLGSGGIMALGASALLKGGEKIPGRVTLPPSPEVASPARAAHSIRKQNKALPGITVPPIISGVNPGSRSPFIVRSPSSPPSVSATPQGEVSGMSSSMSSAGATLQNERGGSGSSDFSRAKDLLTSQTEASLDSLLNNADSLLKQGMQTLTTKKEVTKALLANPKIQDQLESVSLIPERNQVYYNFQDGSYYVLTGSTKQEYESLRNMYRSGCPLPSILHTRATRKIEGEITRYHLTDAYLENRTEPPDFRGIQREITQVRWDSELGRLGRVLRRLYPTQSQSVDHLMTQLQEYRPSSTLDSEILDGLNTQLRAQERGERYGHMTFDGLENYLQRTILSPQANNFRNNPNEDFPAVWNRSLSQVSANLRRDYADTDMLGATEDLIDRLHALRPSSRQEAQAQVSWCTELFALIPYLRRCYSETHGADSVENLINQLQERRSSSLRDSDVLRDLNDRMRDPGQGSLTFEMLRNQLRQNNLLPDPYSENRMNPLPEFRYSSFQDLVTQAPWNTQLSALSSHLRQYYSGVYGTDSVENLITRLQTYRPSSLRDVDALRDLNHRMRDPRHGNLTLDMLKERLQQNNLLSSIGE